MNNMNIDENTMKNIKNMVDNGNISDAISNISPEMIQNFSKLLSNQENNNQNKESNTTNTNQSKETTNFDFNGIDMDTVMKMSSVLGKMKNSKDDPRANLLNVTKIAEIMKENKENNKNV